MASATLGPSRQQHWGPHHVLPIYLCLLVRGNRAVEAMEVKRRAAQALVNRLSSGGDDESLSDVLAEIRLLSKNDPDSRAHLADAGAIPLLTRRLSSDGDTKGNAAASLLNISISARVAVMSTPGILDALTSALRGASPAAAQHAAATTYSLLSVDAYRPIIGSKRPLLSALISLLRGPTRSVKDALKALFGVSLYPLNRSTMVELGAVPALFSLIVKDGRGGVVEDASAVVAQVAGCYESVEAFRGVAGVRVLVDLVDAGNGASGRARENAVAALLNLAMAGGERAVGDIREVEGAEAAVAELAGGGSERAKHKAEALLGVLVSERESLQHLHHRLDHDLYPPLPSPCCSSSSVDTDFSGLSN